MSDESVFREALFAALRKLGCSAYEPRPRSQRRYVDYSVLRSSILYSSMKEHDPYEAFSTPFEMISIAIKPRQDAMGIMYESGFGDGLAKVFGFAAAAEAFSSKRDFGRLSKMLAKGKGNARNRFFCSTGEAMDFLRKAKGDFEYGEFLELFRTTSIRSKKLFGGIETEHRIQAAALSLLNKKDVEEFSVDTKGKAVSNGDSIFAMAAIGKSELYELAGNRPEIASAALAGLNAVCSRKKVLSWLGATSVDMLRGKCEAKHFAFLAETSGGDVRECEKRLSRLIEFGLNHMDFLSDFTQSKTAEGSDRFFSTFVLHEKASLVDGKKSLVKKI